MPPETTEDTQQQPASILTPEQVYQAAQDDNANTPADDLAKTLGFRDKRGLLQQITTHILNKQNEGIDLLFPRLNVPLPKPKASANTVRRRAIEDALRVPVNLLKDLGFDKVGSFEAVRAPSKDDPDGPGYLVFKPTSFLEAPKTGFTVNQSSIDNNNQAAAVSTTLPGVPATPEAAPTVVPNQIQTVDALGQPLVQVSPDAPPPGVINAERVQQGLPGTTPAAETKKVEKAEKAAAKKQDPPAAPAKDKDDDLLEGMDFLQSINPAMQTL